jgi:hypothetical protein
MISTATYDQPLQYFIHYDFDALRMEIAGSLVGKAAQRAYEAWRTAILTARLPLVIDISFVTKADEDGRAALQSALSLGCQREQEVRIVAPSGASRAIADSVLSAPVTQVSPHKGLVDRVVSWLAGRTAGNPACAERAEMQPAGAKQKSAQNAGFLMRGGMERRVR